MTTATQTTARTMTTATQTTARTTSRRLGSVRSWFTLLAIATSITACGGEALNQGNSGNTSQGPGGEQAPLVLSCDSAQRFELSHNTCGAMDAKAIPDSNGQHCYCALGFAWNGSSCESLDDCSCQGGDCNKLTQTKQQCEKLHSSCKNASDTQIACGSIELHASAHDTCSAMDAKAIPDSNGQHCYCALGFAWNGSSCESLDDCSCQGADCNKLATSKEECEKQHAACPSQAPEKPYTCGDDGRFANMHQVCAPMDAKAVGTDDGMHCNCALGFAWNGTSCDFLADCRCEGADCDKLTLDKDECEKLHKACVN